MGMLGGIAVLGILSMMAKGLSAYGLDAIFNAVVDDLEKRGISVDEIIQQIKEWPIPGFIIVKIVDLMRARRSPSSSPGSKSSGPKGRSFVSLTHDLDIGSLLELRELHSATTELIRIASKVTEGVWEGVIENGDSNEIVKVVFMEGSFREFISPTRSLTVGEHYHLMDRQSSQISRIQVEVEIDDGFWFGVCIEPACNEEIVYIVYQIG
jgi:hypothetical protein